MQNTAFCVNDKKAISQNIFEQNLYEIFTLCRKKLKEYAEAIFLVMSDPSMNEL